MTAWHVIPSRVTSHHITPHCPRHNTAHTHTHTHTQHITSHHIPHHAPPSWHSPRPNYYASGPEKKNNHLSFPSGTCGSVQGSVKLNTHISVHVNTHVHAYTYTCTHTDIYTHSRYMHAHAHTYKHTHTHTHTHTHIYIYIYIDIYDMHLWIIHTIYWPDTRRSWVRIPLWANIYICLQTVKFDKTPIYTICYTYLLLGRS